jgi:hypothetical protein
MAKKTFAQLAKATSTWDPFTSPVNYVLLGGRKSPGVTDLEGIPEEFKKDIRWGMGMSGATSPMVGRPPISFSMHHRLYTPEHFLSWNEWLAYIQPEITFRSFKGAVAKAQVFDIVHPFTKAARILSIFIDKIEHPKQTRDDGEWTAVVHMTEWRMPKASYAKPEDPKGPEPKSPLERELDEAMGKKEAARKEMVDALAK